MTPADRVARRSRVRHGRLRFAVHVVLGVATVALGVWAGLRWSLVAVDVDARVTATSWAEEGPAFKVLQLDDGRTLTIDDDLMQRMGGPERVVGEVVTSSAGERSGTVAGRRIPLSLSPTAWQTIVLLGAIAAVGAVRLRRADPGRDCRTPPLGKEPPESVES